MLKENVNMQNLPCINIQNHLMVLVEDTFYEAVF